MLPAAHRLRSSADFAAVIRAGRKARSGDLVVYLRNQDTESLRRSDDQTADVIVRAPRVGLIVGKPVGGSVVRHQVSRRLRHQAASRLPGLEPATDVVIRALPDSAKATSAKLGRDLDGALRRLNGNAARVARR